MSITSADTITGRRTVDHGPSVLYPGNHRYGVELSDGWTWAFADPVTGRVARWADRPTTRQGANS